MNEVQGLLNYKEVLNPEGQEEDDWANNPDGKDSQDWVEEKYVADYEAKNLTIGTTN